MTVYHCCFLDRHGHTDRMVAIRAADVSTARRKAMSLMTERAAFSGFELWGDGRKIITYEPPKADAPQLADSESPTS
jgi:hypothetical protein